MKPLNLYFNLLQKIQSVKSIYEIVFLNMMVLLLTVVSYEAVNPTLSIWSSLLAGFTFGIVLVKLPNGMTYLKKNRQNDSN